MDLKKDFLVEHKKYPTNLYRDDKAKALIMNFLMKNQKKIFKEKVKKAAKMGSLESIIT